MRIGMVFQKPNPFPAMTVSENVIAGLKLSGVKATKADRRDLVESLAVDADESVRDEYSQIDSIPVRTVAS